MTYNASMYKEQVDDAINFLSEKIFHLQLLTHEDLRGAVPEERLEGYYFAGFKLSTAIVHCLVVAIKLATSKYEGNEPILLSMLIISVEGCHFNLNRGRHEGSSS